MNYPRLYLFFFSLLLAGWLASCSNPSDNLDNQISESLENDNAIDVTEKDALRVFIVSKSKELTKDQKTATLITPDGKVNEAALEAYIKRNRTYRKLAKIGKAPNYWRGGSGSNQPANPAEALPRSQRQHVSLRCPQRNGYFQKDTEQPADGI